jgi:hypothetical protein
MRLSLKSTGPWTTMPPHPPRGPRAPTRNLMASSVVQSQQQTRIWPLASPTLPVAESFRRWADWCGLWSSSAHNGKLGSGSQQTVYRYWVGNMDPVRIGPGPLKPIQQLINKKQIIKACLDHL